MAEQAPVFTNDHSTGPNDAVYAAIADEAARAADQANEPAAEFAVAASSETTPATTEPAAPLAGKFKDAKELEKAYLELQQKLGASSKPAETKKEETPDAPAPESLIAPEALNDFVTEYQSKNGLSEESYGKLQKMGLSKAVVDAYIEGQKALVDRQVEAVYAQVGGKETFGRVLEWAATALPPDEQEAFNGIMASNDLKAATFAMKNLKARFEADSRSPVRVTGRTDGSTSAGFRSQNEMIAAMTDPRYKADPAFRREVAMRMANSKFIND